MIMPPCTEHRLRIVCLRWLLRRIKRRHAGKSRVRGIQIQVCSRGDGAADRISKSGRPASGASSLARCKSFAAGNAKPRRGGNALQHRDNNYREPKNKANLSLTDSAGQPILRTLWRQAVSIFSRVKARCQLKHCRKETGHRTCKGWGKRRLPVISFFVIGPDFCRAVPLLLWKSRCQRYSS